MERIFHPYQSAAYFVFDRGGIDGQPDCVPVAGHDSGDFYAVKVMACHAVWVGFFKIDAVEYLPGSNICQAQPGGIVVCLFR